jgi:hypothetical protein
MRQYGYARRAPHRPIHFFFFSLENNEPPHIHVQRDKDVAKFWLNPVALASNRRYAEHELTRIRKLVEANRNLLLRGWHDHFGTPDH